MRGVFSFDGPVFEFLNRVADLFILNIIFIICCIPVFTIGAAITAMYYVLIKIAGGEEGYTVKGFFKSFRQNFRQATLIWIPMLVLLIIFGVDFYAMGNLDIFPMKGLVRVVVVFMCLVFLMTFIYVFPVLARFENTVKQTVKNALFMAIRHLPYTLALVAICAVPGVLLYFAPSMGVLLMLMFGFSGIAYANSYLFNRIFAYYIPQKESGDSEAADPDKQDL